MLPALSIVGSITWVANGVEPGLEFVFVLAELSEEDPLGGGGVVPTPPKGGFMEKELAEKPEVLSFDIVFTED